MHRGRGRGRGGTEWGGGGGGVEQRGGGREQMTVQGSMPGVIMCTCESHSCLPLG